MWPFNRDEKSLPRLTKDERPLFAFCEGVLANGRSRWHIREVTAGLLKLGGGINTASLCGHVKSAADGGGGWDLNVRITEHHLSHCCTTCRNEYLKRAIKIAK